MSELLRVHPGGYVTSRRFYPIGYYWIDLIGEGILQRYHGSRLGPKRIDRSRCSEPKLVSPNKHPRFAADVQVKYAGTIS